MTAEAFAPAKINLTLHVTGRRDDGYHLLSSLVVFANVGDRLRIEPAEGLSLGVTGPFAAGVPTDGSNLVIRAAEALRRARGVEAGAAITLEKHLPHGGGIGGGSADAAACLRALTRLWGVAPLGPAEALVLGADVPVCLGAPAPQWMKGIGEQLAAGPALPDLPMVLVNPGIHLSTPEVFRAGGFSAGRAAAEEPEPYPAGGSFEAVLGWLGRQCNDLQAPAISLAPEVGAALASLAGDRACRLARMSGSGSTVWGVFPTPAEADAACARIAAVQPDWWVRSAIFGQGGLS